MSGLLDGFKYDIFISYRQNDNKYDGWVTEFVTNLKKELEATIKEKLRIFFDENPEDGLLESYSVEKSIENKLNTLIFIPVISQTYCDISSYAWNYEFRAFNKSAKNDRFGRDIRLTNNNVASRILPVKIHEIDPEDKVLLESELGEKPRCIDFIYRSYGVNRPLRALEDHPHDNLNKTYYRDQINKVANAVKDIIIVLKKQGAGYQPLTQYEKKRETFLSRQRIRQLVFAGILVLFVLLLIIFMKTLANRSFVKSEEKSIAVLPFRNDSPSDSNAYFINGIMEEILNNLQKIKDIRIISRTSVEQYRNTSKSVPQIARELGVNYIVEGSGQRYGNSFRVNVQLIRAKKENYLWGKLYEQKIGKPGDIISVQSSIAQSIVTELRGTMTPEEKKMIEKVPTTNLSAYDYYQKGKEEFSKYWIDVSDYQSLSMADKFFRRALESDPAFADAIVGRAEVLWNYRNDPKRKNIKDSVLMLTDIALSYDDKNAEAYVIKGWCYDDEGLADKALQYYQKAIDLNPNDWKAYFALAELYDFVEPVKSLASLSKAASLTHGDAEMPTLLRHIGGELLITGFPEKASQFFGRAFELDGDSAVYLSCLGGIEHNQGNYTKALEFYEKAYVLKKNYAEVIQDLAIYYQIAGKNVESLKFYTELESTNSLNYNMHRMGYSLWKNGFRKEAEDYFRKHIDYCNTVLKTSRRSNLIAYAYYDLAGISAFKGDSKKAYQYLRLFNQSKNCFTYMLTLIKNDPLFINIKSDPEFRQIVDDMETKLDKIHQEVAKWLDEQNELKSGFPE